MSIASDISKSCVELVNSLNAGGRSASILVRRNLEISFSPCCSLELDGKEGEPKAAGRLCVGWNLPMEPL